MTVAAVLQGKTLSTKEFSDVLINEVKSGHARLHHPFYLALYDGKLSLDEIRVWAQGSMGYLRLQCGDQYGEARTLSTFRNPRPSDSKEVRRDYSIGSGLPIFRGNTAAGARASSPFSALQRKH